MTCANFSCLLEVFFFFFYSAFFFMTPGADSEHRSCGMDSELKTSSTRSFSVVGAEEQPDRDQAPDQRLRAPPGCSARTSASFPSFIPQRRGAIRVVLKFKDNYMGWSTAVCNRSKVHAPSLSPVGDTSITWQQVGAAWAAPQIASGLQMH